MKFYTLFKWLALCWTLSSALGLIGVSHAAVPRQPLDLISAIQLALDRSPVYDTARRTAEIGQLSATSAGALMLPSADLIASQGLSQPNLTLNAPWTSQLTLSLTENLYDNGATLNRYRAALLGRDLTRLASAQARDSLTLGVAQEFYQYSLSVYLLDARKKQHELVKKQFDQTDSRYREGLKTRQDYLRLKAQLQRSELDLLESSRVIQAARIELRRLIGVEEPESPDSQLDFVPVPASDLLPPVPSVTPASSQSFESREAKIQESINVLSVNLAERRYWPQIFVTGNASYGYANYLGGPGFSGASAGPVNWSALVGIQYNLWDWGIRRRDISVAEHTERIGADTLRQSVMTVDAGAETVIQRLAKLKAEHELNRDLLSVSKEGFESVDKSYREGKSTYLDIITSLNDLVDARGRVYTTYFSVLTDLAQYRYYEGTLYETLTAHR